ncbi:hypothetical protein [Sphingomonas sp. HMP6]|uniref:hypothetical protein n=1 Tax=Sphingomonas sp. HMP6 TaxID=1517551 RepID=UPI0015970D62|nr:hypothetical protein [Sphingomonas sp. HMP6]BCA59917.1 hypothetical protein HMP06_2686 [Sphingomonas sp. HMP6]
MSGSNSYFNAKPYIPASLSEIYDTLGSMILGAPTFVDRWGDFPNRNIDSEFNKLTQGFALVRKKLGEERYAKLIDLAARAKALFAADQDDTNGKTDEGRALLFEIEDEIQAARRGRVKAKLPDEDGEITGD